MGGSTTRMLELAIAKSSVHKIRPRRSGRSGNLDPLIPLARSSGWGRIRVRLRRNPAPGKSFRLEGVVVVVVVGLGLARESNVLKPGPGLFLGAVRHLESAAGRLAGRGDAFEHTSALIGKGSDRIVIVREHLQCPIAIAILDVFGPSQQGKRRWRDPVNRHDHPDGTGLELRGGHGRIVHGSEQCPKGSGQQRDTSARIERRERSQVRKEKMTARVGSTGPGSISALEAIARVDMLEGPPAGKSGQLQAP